MGDKQNLAKESQLALKQDLLIAGSNITIAADGKTISAANPTSVTVTPLYQAGTLVAAIVVNGNTTNIYAPQQHGDNANQNLATPFNASSTYAVDDYVIYQENLYKCITAITTAAAWDATKWTRVLVTDEMGQGGDNANQNIADTYSISSTYDVDDFVIFNGLLYKCTTAVTTPGTFNPNYWTQTIIVDEMGSGGGTSLPENWSINEDALSAQAIIEGLNELGWKVEDDTYYFDTAASFSLGDREYTKENAKPALGGVIGQPGDGQNKSIVFTSTDASATHFSWNTTTYSFTYLGTTWYYCGGDYAFWGSPASGIEVIPDGTLTLEQAAKYLIDYSQVSFTDNRFTTMNQPGTGVLFAGGGEESDLSDATFKVTTDGQVNGTNFLINNVSLTNVFTGADGTNAGVKGLVPAPSATDNLKFLRGDGTWAEGSGGGGGSYSTTDIWIGNETPTTSGMNITLTDNISNYDMIYFVVGNNSYSGENIYFPSELTIGDTYIGTVYGGDSLGAYWTYISDTQIKIMRQANAYPVIYTKIVGVNFGGGGGSNTHNYSTSEQVVGTWVDGKTIYERSINLGSFSVSTGGEHVIENITNIDTFIKYTGYIIESGIKYCIPDSSIRIMIRTNNNLIFQGVGGSWSVSEGYVTIQYTKTAS